jgi:hypothetical protein
MENLTPECERKLRSLVVQDRHLGIRPTADDVWPNKWCDFTPYAHRAHPWKDEPGDGFRYAYWCDGEQEPDGDTDAEGK